MSELAERERIVKRGWASPGGGHDAAIRLLKLALPVLIGLLGAYLVLAPLARDREFSFLLDKDKVDVAEERMRAEAARYRGLDDKGRPFTISAREAVQPTSREPIVDISGMAARIELEDGPASLRADTGRYNLDAQTVEVIGPLLFNAYDGYRLETSDVTVNLGSQRLVGDGRVVGRMPLGRFSADSMTANLAEQTVTLRGRARLHIVQGGVR